MIDENRCCRYVQTMKCVKYDELQQALEENEKLKKKLDYCFKDYSDFCDKCVAKNKCNGSCCYNQFKELFEYEK